MSARAKKLLPADLGKHAVLWAFIAVELLPLYMMFQISFKDNATFLAQPWWPSSPATWHWQNWWLGLRTVGPYIANSLFVATLGTAGTLVLATLGAYFFARRRMPGASFLWSAFLTLMLIPSVANIVPLFTLMKELNLLNSLLGLVVVAIAMGQVFNIFVLRNFIEDLPKDLFEAAHIDGATHLQQIWHVVVPLSAPILGTLSILTFLGLWNDFLLPLIVLRDPELFTVGVGLIYLDAQYVKDWGQLMAAYFIAAIPLVVIFLFCMRLFVRGLSSGAIKG